MSDLRALSLLQPWLWAILERHKGIDLPSYGFLAIENRTWKPPPAVIGQRIALHASLGYDADGAEFIDDQLFAAGAVCAEAPPKASCARGAILGTAVVSGAVSAEPFGLVANVAEKVWDLVRASPWAFGPWCWILRDVRKLPAPVPCRGALGLWTVPEEAARAVLAQEAA